MKEEWKKVKGLSQAKVYEFSFENSRGIYEVY